MYDCIIDVVSEYGIFGELGVLTNLCRTCTVVAREHSVFQTISKESMNLVKENCPEVLRAIEEKMINYDD